jgi:DNA-binding MarR family transcriptional regulator
MTSQSDFSTFEANTARLRQLTDEVSRIATTLAHLAVQPEVFADSGREAPVNDGPEFDIPVELVRYVIQARRLRNRFFAEGLFADPAWDMLLDLFQAEIAQLRVSVSSLCAASAVPQTTALRWIKAMTEADLFRRRSDPIDARRVFVELSPTASQAMRRYFHEVGDPQSVMSDYPEGMRELR